MPNLTNVGVMTERQLIAILNQFPKDKAKIVRGEIIIKVYSAKGTMEIVSAAIVGDRTWHVRAVPGLLVAV